MELANLTWTDVDALDRDIPVIIPIAALEQHGRHLPALHGQHTDEQRSFVGRMKRSKSKRCLYR